MSDEDLRSLPDEKDLSFDVVSRDENAASVQELHSRIKLLEESNLALRQELSKAKRSSSRADDQIAKDNDKQQTAPKKGFDQPTNAGSNSMSSRIVQSQDAAYRKLSDKQDATPSEYMPSLQSSQSQSHRWDTHQKQTFKDDTPSSTVQDLMAANSDLAERLRKLEINEQYGTLQNRVAVCERKMDSLISQRNNFETKIRNEVSDMAAQNQFKERTFQAFILNKTRLDKPFILARLDQFQRIFFASVHFSQETCEYTVPESGLYEFHVRWRQSGKGQIRVTIHWGEEKVSRLGQTSFENDVLCPVVRRYVKEGVKVWLSASLVSGSAKLETCDFGGSFITTTHANAARVEVEV